MPLLLLQPNETVKLSPNTDPNDKDAVSNPNATEGQYEFLIEETIIQKFIQPHGYQAFLSPKPAGISIRNNGNVPLTIITPGL